MIYRIFVCAHSDLYWAALHTSDLTISSGFEQMAGHLIICPHTRTHSREHMPHRPLGRARVPETSSAFPFGKSEQLNRPPWLKVARWLWPFVPPPPNFSTPQRSGCVGGRSAVQRWPLRGPLLYGLLTPVQPAGSELCPGKAISAFCHVWGRCSSSLKRPGPLAGRFVPFMKVCVSVLQLHTASFIWWS